MDIYQKLAAELPQMSKTQAKIANYILSHKNEVSFYNVRKLSRLVGVSEASVIRFSVFMGFKGYPELREALQEATQKHLSSKERLIISYQAYNENDILDVMKDDVNNIIQTLENTDTENVKKICSEIMSAKRIFIISCRSAISLGSFFWYYLNMILDNVTLISSYSDEIERMETATSEDLFIGLSFERYSKATYRMMMFAKEKGCKTISITDNLLSPLIPYSDYYLLSCTKVPTFLDSFVAPLSLINMLLTYIGRAKNVELEKRLQEYDNIWNTFDLFV
ncbi:Transcriptional regulator, RpiR family [Ruminococcaceae bacterium BL-6]|nr:Transcriptional regulator, RpiR family [Ruminococcaceae bacterium BL-6]